MPPSKKPLRLLLYARKSTDQDDRQVASIPDQLVAGQALAAREGHQIVAVYQESASAKAPGRVQFAQMLDALKEKKADGILAWHLDRLSRNPIDSGNLAWLLQSHLLKAIVTPQQTYLPDDNALLLSVQFGSTTQYSRDLSVNIRRGLQSLAAAGYWHTTRVPYGYRAVPTGEGKRRRLELDPERAPAVRRLYELVASGYSLRQARRQLLTEIPDLDLPNATHLSTLLRNQVYLGSRIYGRRVRQGTTLASLPPDQWHITHGTHPPLVTEAVYQQAVARLRERDPGMSGAARGKDLLVGLLRCRRCGGSMQADKRYYSCYNRLRYQNCTQPGISRADLTATVLETLSAELVDVEFLGECVEAARQAQEQGQRAPTRTRLAKQAADLDRRQERLYAALERGTMEVLELERRLAVVRQERAEVDAALLALGTVTEGPPITLALAQAYLGRWVELMASGALPVRRQALRDVVRQITVDYPAAEVSLAILGQERTLRVWVTPPPEIPADLSGLRHCVLANLVRQTRRFLEQRQFPSKEVGTWTREKCIEYLEGHRKNMPGNDL